MNTVSDPRYVKITRENVGALPLTAAVYPHCDGAVIKSVFAAGNTEFKELINGNTYVSTLAVDEQLRTTVEELGGDPDIVETRTMDADEDGDVIMYRDYSGYQNWRPLWCDIWYDSKQDYTDAIAESAIIFNFKHPLWTESQQECDLGEYRVEAVVQALKKYPMHVHRHRWIFDGVFGRALFESSLIFEDDDIIYLTGAGKRFLAGDGKKQQATEQESVRSKISDIRDRVVDHIIDLLTKQKGQPVYFGDEVETKGEARTEIEKGISND